MNANMTKPQVVHDLFLCKTANYVVETGNNRILFACMNMHQFRYFQKTQKALEIQSHKGELSKKGYALGSLCLYEEQTGFKLVE